MTGVYRENTTNADFSKILGNLTSDKGIGEPIITEFLTGIPGVTENSVRQQLAMLKSSGDYARIITEVKDEIEAENKEAIKAAEKAEAERIAAKHASRRDVCRNGRDGVTHRAWAPHKPVHKPWR